MSTVVRSIGALLLIGAVLLITGVAVVYMLMQPVDTTATTTTQFVVPKGQAVGVTANRLQDSHLIKNALVFRVYLKQKGLESKFQPGSFEISPSMNMSQVAQTLTSGTNDTWVTLLEGWRREEIADSLVRTGFPQFDKQEFLTLTATSEGKLFPDTYLIPKQATAQDVYQLLTNTFDKKVTQGLASEIKQSPHSFKDALIMASIIQREAQTPDQMKEISGVFWNRVSKGMALQSDVTLQYVKGYDTVNKTWWPVPTSQDKYLESPYNTYMNATLPPAPIANPGLDAIEAALDPNKTDNLFFLPDDQGTMHYAKTLEEHNQNIDRYLR